MGGAAAGRLFSAFRRVALCGLFLLVGQLVLAAEPAPSPAEKTAAPTRGLAGRAEDQSASGFSLPGSDGNEPLEIEARTLEFDARENIAVFAGDVVTTQGDVVMRSATLRIEFPQSGGPIGNIERPRSVVAEGDVRIEQGARVARGQRAEFNEAERVLVLSGGAVLHEGSNEVRGERIIVYLDEDRSVVEGTRSRVKAILVPDAKLPSMDAGKTRGSGQDGGRQAGSEGSEGEGAQP